MFAQLAQEAFLLLLAQPLLLTASAQQVTMPLLTSATFVLAPQQVPPLAAVQKTNTWEVPMFALTVQESCSLTPVQLLFLIACVLMTNTPSPTTTVTLVPELRQVPLLALVQPTRTWVLLTFA